MKQPTFRGVVRPSVLFLVLAAVHPAQAVQISPNPNPFGNVISVTTGTPDTNSGVFTNNGDIEIDTVIFRNETTGTIDNSSTGAITVGADSGFPGGIYKNDGVLNNSGNVLMQGGGGLDNHLTTSVINNLVGGLIELDANLSGSVGAMSNRSVINNDGGIVVRAGTLVNALSGSVSGSGELIVDGGYFLNGTATSVGTVDQDSVGVTGGTLEIDVAGSMTGGEFLAEDGLTLVNGSLMMDTVDVIGGAILSGTGSVGATAEALYVGVDALVAPGMDETNVAGTLNLESDLNLSGTYEATIENVGSHDVIDAIGFNVDLDSTFSFLDLVVLSEPAYGDYWDLILADSITGSFGGFASTLDFGCDPEVEECPGPFSAASVATTGDFLFTADIIADAYGSTDVLRVTVSSASAVPVPGAVWLFGAGLLGLIGMSRRRQST